MNSRIDYIVYFQRYKNIEEHVETLISIICRGNNEQGYYFFINKPPRKLLSKKLIKQLLFELEDKETTFTFKFLGGLPINKLHDSLFDGNRGKRSLIEENEDSDLDFYYEI